MWVFLGVFNQPLKRSAYPALIETRFIFRDPDPSTLDEQSVLGKYSHPSLYTSSNAPPGK